MDKATTLHKPTIAYAIEHPYTHWVNINNTGV